MSRLFGDMRQVGIVVRDIEAAMRHWVEVCGVGPWFYTDRLAVTAFTYAGERYDDIHLSIALANSGDVQLELIQQRCDRPSMYQRLPRRRPRGHAALVKLAGRLRRPLPPGAGQPATRSARRVTVRAAASSTFATKVTPAR